MPYGTLVLSGLWWLKIVSSSAPIGYLLGALKNVNFDGYALPRVHETCVTGTMTQSSLTVGVLKYTGSYKIKLNVDNFFECD